MLSVNHADFLSLCTQESTGLVSCCYCRELSVWCSRIFVSRTFKSQTYSANSKVNLSITMITAYLTDLYCLQTPAETCPGYLPVTNKYSKFRSFAGRKGAASTEQWAWRTQWEAWRSGWSHSSTGKMERHHFFSSRLSESSSTLIFGICISKIMSHVPQMAVSFRKIQINV